MAESHLLEARLTRSIIGAFCDVYNALGFGLLEHLYSSAMEYELRARGHEVGREVCVDVYYKGFELGRQRLDIIVDGKVVVEVKSTYELHPAAQRQVFNYLRVTRLEIGLLLHFGPRAKVHRLICRNGVLSAGSVASAKSP